MNENLVNYDLFIFKQLFQTFSIVYQHITQKQRKGIQTKENEIFKHILSLHKIKERYN